MTVLIARRPANEFNKNINTVYMFLFGTPEAFIIAQIQMWLKYSNNKRDGHWWVYKTFDEWAEELPFWTERTLKRAFKKLEKNGIVIATDKYNKMRADRTKWYRIDDKKLMELSNTSEAQKVIEAFTAPRRNPRNYMSVEEREKFKFSKDDTENESCSTGQIQRKSKNDEKGKKVTEVINYLNEKTGARYKPSSHANRTLILARMNEGYTVQDFKTVIDNQVSAWKGTEWEKYLRPSTLFRASKIENYLNSKRLNHSQRYNSTVQDQYDNLQYTDLSKEDLSGGPF